ncbi:MAG TPA: transcriptional regulator GcvA [Alphaproteobacteria bacterium]|nr:transcriptional regulator GcvA [Alphaproteobacteria bacterium]
MPDRLPPLPALHAFAIAGRHLSFKAAAAALHLTPSAVSHRIAALERHLGVALFLRLNRRLELTPAGQSYLALVTEAFDRLAQGTAALTARHGRTALRVSAVPYFAASFLIPRLGDFLSRHPEIDLRVDTAQQLVDFGREAVDAAIRLGGGAWPGLAAERLLDVSATPVAAPAVAARLRAPADLAAATLIHLSNTPDAWPRWFEAAGLKGRVPPGGLWVDGMQPALQAAEQGLGVALGLLPLSRDELASGRLAAPLALAMPAGIAYWFVTRPGDERRPAIAAFRTWLFARIREFG